MEAWAELARRRKAWEEESGSAELLREGRVILQAAQVGRSRLPGHLRATMDAEVDLLQRWEVAWRIMRRMGVP
eukprot:14801784-Alexandrium_andersonii.AAC.1